MKQQIRVDRMEKNRMKGLLEIEQTQEMAEECIYTGRREIRRSRG